MNSQQKWSRIFIVGVILSSLSTVAYSQQQVTPNMTDIPERSSPEDNLAKKVFQNPQDLDSLDKLLSIYRRMGKFKTSGRVLSRVLTLNPNIPVSYIKEGVNDALAIRDYYRVIEFTRLLNNKNPSDAENLNSMGFALFNLKKYGVARVALEMSIYLNGKDYRALTNLARVLQAMGNVSRAEEFYQRALAINPNYQLAKRNLMKLKNLSSKSTFAMNSKNKSKRKRIPQYDIKIPPTPSSMTQKKEKPSSSDSVVDKLPPDKNISNIPSQSSPLDSQDNSPIPPSKEEKPTENVGDAL